MTSYSSIIKEQRQRQEWQNNLTTLLQRQIADQQKQIADQQNQIKTLQLKIESQTMAALQGEARNEALLDGLDRRLHSLHLYRPLEPR